MNELNVITSLFQALPAITASLTKCQTILDDYESQRELKQAEKDYLKSILAMYKSGRISSSQAMDSLKHIFNDNKTITVKHDAIETLFNNLLN